MPEHYSPKRVQQLVRYDLPREFLARQVALELTPEELFIPIGQIYDVGHVLPGEQ